jgi:putative transposase
MPRQPRLDLHGVPTHVVHRGVDRRAIVLDDEDRHHYCLLLRWPASALLCGCMRFC